MCFYAENLFCNLKLQEYTPGQKNPPMQKLHIFTLKLQPDPEEFFSNCYVHFNQIFEHLIIIKIAYMWSALAKQKPIKLERQVSD